MTDRIEAKHFFITYILYQFLALLLFEADIMNGMLECTKELIQEPTSGSTAEG